MSLKIGDKVIKGEEFAEKLAEHAVAYQSIATCEEGIDKLVEEAYETSHITVDSLAYIMPADDAMHLALELPESELEDGCEKKPVEKWIACFLASRLDEAVDQRVYEKAEERITMGCRRR